MTFAALCFALLPPIGLIADVRGTAVVSDTQQVSVRPAIDLLGQRVEGYAYDFDNTPAINLSFGWKRSELVFEYLPRFTIRDAFSDRRTELALHTGRVSYSVSYPRSRFTVSQSVTAGTQNFSALTPVSTSTPATMPTAATPAPTGTGPTLAVLAINRNLFVGSETTSVLYSYSHTRTITSNSFASFQISGGLDAPAQRVLPRQRVLTEGINTLYRLNKRDGLLFSVTGSESWFDTGVANVLLTQSVGWLHAWTPNISSTLTVGVAEGWTKPAGGEWGAPTIGPLVSASLGGNQLFYLVRRRHFAVTLGFGASTVPTLNQFSGELQQTAQANTTLSVIADKTTMAATGYVAQTFPASDLGAARVIGASLYAIHSPSKLVDLIAGYRTSSQNISADPAYSALPPSGRQWVAYVAITVRAPVMSF